MRERLCFVLNERRGETWWVSDVISSIIPRLMDDQKTSLADRADELGSLHP